MKLDIVQIMAVLPHRYPFLMVDRIVEGNSGEYAVGIKNVTINEPFFQGHWPGNPIMPGVLIAEALAQVAAFICLKELEGNAPFFGGISDIRFKKKVVPGDQLRMIAVLKRRRGNVFQVAVEATVEGKIVAKGELTFQLIPKDRHDGNGGTVTTVETAANAAPA